MNSYIYLGVSGYIAHSCAWNQVSLADVLRALKLTGKMNVLLIESVLKGYRECPLKYSDG